MRLLSNLFFVLLLLAILALDVLACGNGGQNAGNGRRARRNSTRTAAYATSVAGPAYGGYNPYPRNQRTVVLNTVTPTTVIPAAAPPANMVAVPCPSCPGGVRYIRAPKQMPR